MQIIAIANHKGGVGKTATTHALGIGLAEMGHRVLLVDIDPQASLTAAAGVQDAAGRTLAEVMGGVEPGKLRLAETLVNVADDDTAVCHLAPSDIALSPNELGLVQRIGRENILFNALLPVSRSYNVCLIDCPPSLGLLTVNALRAATAVIIPTQPQISDLRGLGLFSQTIARIRGQINPKLFVLGILITFYDPRLIHHQEAVNLLKQQGLPLFKTMIGRSVRVAEAPAAGESILTYDPQNPQAENYRALTHEVNQWLKSGQK